MKKYITTFLFVSVLINALLLAAYFYKDNGSISEISEQGDGQELELIYKDMNNDFILVNDLQSFRDFNINYPATIMYFLSLKKAGDKNLWDKYAKYLYESGGAEMGEQEYYQKIEDMFSPNYSDLRLVSGQEYIDTDIILSGENLVDSEKFCQEQFSSNDSRVLSCLDNLYFYRSSDTGDLCNNISSTYKERFCLSFHNFR